MLDKFVPELSSLPIKNILGIFTVLPDVSSRLTRVRRRFYRALWEYREIIMSGARNLRLQGENNITMTSWHCLPNSVSTRSVFHKRISFSSRLWLSLRSSAIIHEENIFWGQQLSRRSQWLVNWIIVGMWRRREKEGEMEEMQGHALPRCLCWSLVIKNQRGLQARLCSVGFFVLASVWKP